MHILRLLLSKYLLILENYFFCRESLRLKWSLHLILSVFDTDCSILLGSGWGLWAGDWLPPPSNLSRVAWGPTSAAFVTMQGLGVRFFLFNQSPWNYQIFVNKTGVYQLRAYGTVLPLSLSAPFLVPSGPALTSPSPVFSRTSPKLTLFLF